MLNRTLVIRHEPSGADTLRWFASDAAGPLRSGRCRPSELPSLLRGRRLLLLVPGIDLLLTETSLATRNRQQLRRALPYALEDQLAADVDDLHFSVTGGTAPYGVAVVARDTLDHWLAPLLEHDVHPDAVLPEPLALPLAEGEWSLLLEDHQATLRTGAQAGFACEPENLTTLLELALAQSEQAPFMLRGYDARSQREFPADTLLPDGLRAQWRELREADGWLAENLSEVPINLLQGDYSRREQLQRLWRPWRMSAALLLAVVGLQLALLGSDYTRLKSTDEAQAVRMVELYRQAFPESKRVVDPRQQFESGLRALREGGGDIALVSLLARSAAPIGQAKGVTLSNLRFREGRLELELRLPDLSALDRLKAALVQAGLAVNIQSASSREEGVESRLEISEVGA